MDTDEFQISLLRELAVCKASIKRIERLLEGMEVRHNVKTESFVKAFEGGAMDEHNDDYRVWADNYEALKRWKKLERQYEELFQMMKV